MSVSNREEEPEQKEDKVELEMTDFSVRRDPGISFAAVPGGPQIVAQQVDQQTPSATSNQNNQIVVRALHSPAFGRYESQQNLPEGSILQEETSKTDQSE